MSPAITPEMRDTAIDALAAGVPASSLGTVLPSPHPDYLKALFLGPMSQVDLFFKRRDQDPQHPTNGVNDDDYVVYCDEWLVDEITDQAIAMKQNETATTNTNNTEQPVDNDLNCLEKTITVRRTQNRATRSLNALRTKVHNWNALDELRERKTDNALELIVNDPLAQLPGALTNMVTHWRTRLGWIQPSTGYALDATPALLTDQRFKFVAYGTALARNDDDQYSIDGSDLIAAANGENDIGLTKYLWSDLSGVWKTQEGIVRELDNIKKERNAYLINSINRIQQEFYDDLVMEGAGFVARYLTGRNHEITVPPTEVPASWSGGVVPGQKTTKRRKIKKQAPQRGLSTANFVPEDGGLTPLQALAKATAVDKKNQPSAQEPLTTTEPEFPESFERGAPSDGHLTLPEFLQRQPAGRVQGNQTAKGLTPATEKAIEKPVAKPAAKTKKGGKKAKSITATKKKTTTATNKRKRSQDDDDDSAPATAPATRSASAPALTVDPNLPWIEPAPSPASPGRKKLNIEPELPRVDPPAAPTSPSKKKRKTEPAAKPAPEATTTRKSSRIAKRKADSMEPEEPTIAAAATTTTTNVPSAAAKPAKKRKTSVEPPAQPKTRAKTPAPGKQLSTIPEVDEDNNLAAAATTVPAAAAPSASSSAAAFPPREASPEYDLVSIHTTPQATPIQPTSSTLSTAAITAADYPTMTPALRSELLANYSFLASLSSPPAALEVGTGDDNDLRPSRQDDWISFLSFFGRDTSTVERVNAFFGRDGALALEYEFLDQLKVNVAGLRRVIGDGQEDLFVWV